MAVIEKYLKVKTFTTPDGKPTCASNFSNWDICRFLGSTKFGTVDYCLALGVEIRRDGELQNGFTIPNMACPMNDAVVFDTKENTK